MLGLQCSFQGDVLEYLGMHLRESLDSSGVAMITSTKLSRRARDGMNREDRRWTDGVRCWFEVLTRNDLGRFPRVELAHARGRCNWIAGVCSFACWVTAL